MPIKNRKVAPRDGIDGMARVEDILKKMMKRFDASDENAKEFRGDLADIREKLNAHGITIKHLELQMALLSSTMNPHQSGSHPSNTVHNPKNKGHFMLVTSRGGKQIIDPYTLFVLKDVVRRDVEAVEVSDELVDKSGKEAETPKRLPPFLDHHHHSQKDW